MKVLLECSHPFFNGVHDARPSVFCGVYCRWAPEITLVLVEFVLLNLVFCRSLFVLFLLVIVLCVLWFMASDYPFGIFTLLTIVLSVLWFMASDYPFGIFKTFLLQRNKNFKNGTIASMSFVKKFVFYGTFGQFLLVEQDRKQT